MAVWATSEEALKMYNKAKAISAKLFEVNLKVQLCNLVTV